MSKDGSVMNVIRKQMECLEQKLSGHVTKIQQQSDQVANAMLTRVDSKMVLMETLQPKLDHRLAELSGTYKGLSEEMQTQIRRIDGMETRLWEWRHQLEEEIRGKFADSDVSLLRVQNGLRANDEAIQQQDERMQMLEQHLAYQEDANEDLLNLSQRVADIETHNSESVVDRELNSNRDINSSSVSLSTDSLSINCQLADNKKKIDHLMEMSLEVHERLQVHEETVKYLKTVCENDENRSRQLLDLVEHSDWDARIKELQSGFHDLDQHKIEQSDMLEILKRKLDLTERTADETSDRVHRLQEMSMNMGVDELIPDVMHSMTNFMPRTDELQSQLENIRDEMQQIWERTKNVEESNQLASRVGSLVTQLTHVAPKVIQQQKSMDEMTKRINQMDSQIKRLCAEVDSERKRRDGLEELASPGFEQDATE